LQKEENMKKQEKIEEENEPVDLVTESVSKEAPLTETS
jgi:hypothetical protein